MLSACHCNGVLGGRCFIAFFFSFFFFPRNIAYVSRRRCTSMLVAIGLPLLLEDRICACVFRLHSYFRRPAVDGTFRDGSLHVSWHSLHIRSHTHGFSMLLLRDCTFFVETGNVFRRLRKKKSTFAVCARARDSLNSMSASVCRIPLCQNGPGFLPCLD